MLCHPLSGPPWNLPESETGSMCGFARGQSGAGMTSTTASQSADRNLGSVSDTLRRTLLNCAKSRQGSCAVFDILRVSRSVSGAGHGAYLALSFPTYTFRFFTAFMRIHPRLIFALCRCIPRKSRSWLSVKPDFATNNFKPILQCRRTIPPDHSYTLTLLSQAFSVPLTHPTLG